MKNPTVSNYIGHHLPILGLWLFVVAAICGCNRNADNVPQTVTATPATVQVEPRPGNVILLIGDGMGFNHLQAGNLYRTATALGQPYQSFPVQLAMSTYLLNGSYDPHSAWAVFSNLTQGATDSAAAATAMASGSKTYRAGLGVDCQRHAIYSIVQLAEEQGKATGLVTSVPFSHATPAAFVAHNVTRKNYEEIAREMISGSGLDVLMGCGHPWYDHNGQRRNNVDSYQYVGGEQLWKTTTTGQAGADANGDGQADPWTLIESRQDFVRLGNGPTPPRLLGVPCVAETLQQKRGKDAEPGYGHNPSHEQIAPYTVPLIATVPTLEEMSRAALNVLDNNEHGFFLMIEGGAIDWASHDNQSDRLIEEQVDFDHTVAMVCDWVEQHSTWNDTLVLVTADHECGYLTGPGSDPQWQPLTNNGHGVLPGLEWHHTGHTNSLVPLLARGAHAEQLRQRIKGNDPVHGPYLDNTDLFPVMMKVLTR